ncbi:MAG: DUF3501 family protein [Amphritea sp.]|nr:DUF3501 family protein [Amphritea sp.]
MTQLTRNDLFSLEQYALCRVEFRARVMTHKKQRRLQLSPHLALCFEDALTMQYQIQEMLRIERIFEPEGIQEELDVYNPLIPDGHNWKATFMIEYPDIEERKVALGRLIGIEKGLYIQVADFARVYAIANEDLERDTADKTAAVHFVRFELTPEMIAAIQQGQPVKAGTEHPESSSEVTITGAVRESLVGDLH